MSDSCWGCGCIFVYEKGLVVCQVCGVVGSSLGVGVRFSFGLDFSVLRNWVVDGIIVCACVLG